MTSAQAGLLLVVSSPSGAGKTTLCKRLLAEQPELQFSVSYTTRPPRSGERNGIDYHFVSDETFDDMVKNGAFAEWNWVHGRRYGTGIDTVRKALASGCKVLLDIDYQGATRILAEFADSARLVFILPPSLADLEARLRGRGTDSEDVILNRLHKAQKELSHFAMYHYLVLNRDLAAGYEELRAIYRSELAHAEGRSPTADEAALAQSCLTPNRTAVAERILAGGQA